MKNSKNSMKLLATVLTIVLLLSAVATGFSGCQPNEPSEIAPGEDTTTTTTASTENQGGSAPSEKGDEAVVTTTTSTTTAPTTTTTKPTTTTKAAEKTNAKPTTTTKKDSASSKKDYLDTSGLTGTQADVGKVVGWSSVLNKNITVVSVTEGVNGRGCKYIETSYSDGTATAIVECKYCHQMPCPQGGGIQCSKYNVKDDGQITCQQCGRPYGDGYNGTCYGTIDWENGGKAICHHYD